MKKLIMIIGVLLLVACSNENMNFEGAPLKIAIIGEIPEINNDDMITFEQIELEEFSGINLGDTGEFDAVMVTPSMFEEASDDRFVEVYRNSMVPIVFLNSPKRHFPFVNDNVTYETAQWEALNNGSHTTVYLNTSSPDSAESKESIWYFYLKDKKTLNELYKEVFRKIHEL